MGKEIDTFADYMADKTRVSYAEREQINFQVALIGKMIEAREKKVFRKESLQN